MILTAKGRAAVRLAVKEIAAIEAAWLERVRTAGSSSIPALRCKPGYNKIERRSGRE